MRSALRLCLLLGLSAIAASGSPSGRQQHEDGLNHDNDVGYLKKSDDRGADGYEHFESYHDKDGDAYGYEKHEAFGGKKGEKGGSKKGDDYTQTADDGNDSGGGTSEYGPNKHRSYSYSYNSADDPKASDGGADHDDVDGDDEQANAGLQSSDDSEEHDESSEDGNEDAGHSTGSAYAYDSDDGEDGDEDSAYSPSQYKGVRKNGRQQQKSADDEEDDDDDDDDESAEQGGIVHSSYGSNDDDDDDDDDDEEDSDSKSHLKNDDDDEEDDNDDDDDDDDSDDSGSGEKKPVSVQNYNHADQPRHTTTPVHVTDAPLPIHPALQHPILYGTYHKTVHPPIGVPAHSSHRQHHQQQHLPQLQHAHTPQSHVHHQQQQQQQADHGAGHAAGVLTNSYETHVVHTVPPAPKHGEQLVQALPQYPASTAPLHVPQYADQPPATVSYQVHEHGPTTLRSAAYRRPKKVPAAAAERGTRKTAKSPVRKHPKQAGGGADGTDYGSGRQFVYASEADFDATY